MDEDTAQAPTDQPSDAQAPTDQPTSDLQSQIDALKVLIDGLLKDVSYLKRRV